MRTVLQLVFCSVATLVSSVLWVSPAHADYQPPPLQRLIVESDFIVLGTISDVGDDTFVLREFTVVVGPASDAPIEVKRFVDWSGSSRWTRYQAGQKVLLFAEVPAPGSLSRREPR